MTDSTPGRAVPDFGGATTLAALFEWRVRLTPSGEAYRQFDTTAGCWRSYSWAVVAERIQRFTQALSGERLPAGARVAILVPNSVEHVCMDQAALALGFVPVPMHVVDNPESLAYVLADSGASLLFADSADRWGMLAPYQPRLPNLQRVVVLPAPSAGGGTPDAGSARGSAVFGDGVARFADEWLNAAEGVRTTEAVGAPASSDRSAVAGGATDAADADALAALVYTSGTTGRPKGVMLSHRNVLANVRAVMSAVPVREDDVFLSFLPLSHTLERTAGYYLAIAGGATVAFARSVSQLMEDFALVRPTVLISVPRIYERAFTKIREVVDRRWVTRQLFALLVAIGWRRFEHAQGRMRPPSLLARLSWPLLDRWLAWPIRRRFGGRLRAAVTGGARMDPEVGRVFVAAGVPILQGYGMTESSPVVACNTPRANDPQSVGNPLPGVEVRIGEQDELLVRGDNVMKGYWHLPDESARAVDADGWLHTGDRARIADGRVYIMGRLKDILVTSTGEKISPTDLEAAIQTDPVFDQAMVVGEGRPFIAALVVLNAEAWAHQAPGLGLDPKDPGALRSAAAQEWALARIKRAVKQFPSYATPRAVCLSTDVWTVAAGLITPTLKPKRKIIETRFAPEIAALYAGHRVMSPA